MHVPAERTLVERILNGTTLMRNQVEVDPAIGMGGFDHVQSLMADYRWAFEIEICVFPQVSVAGARAFITNGSSRHDLGLAYTLFNWKKRPSKSKSSCRDQASLTISSHNRAASDTADRSAP